MRLIDADKLEVISYNDTEGREDTFDAGVQWMAELIDKQPTVEAVPVTRCKDCKFRNDRLYCRLRKVPVIVTNTDFCSYGERRVDHLALEAETTQIIDGCCTACGTLMDCCKAADYKFCPYCAKRIV